MVRISNRNFVHVLWVHVKSFSLKFSLVRFPQNSKFRENILEILWNVSETPPGTHFTNGWWADRSDLLTIQFTLILNSNDCSRSQSCSCQLSCRDMYKIMISDTFVSFNNDTYLTRSRSLAHKLFVKYASNVWRVSLHIELQCEIYAYFFHRKISFIGRNGHRTQCKKNGCRRSQYLMEGNSRSVLRRHRALHKNAIKHSWQSIQRDLNKMAVILQTTFKMNFIEYKFENQRHNCLYLLSHSPVIKHLCD